MPNSVPLQLLCSLFAVAAGCGGRAVGAGESESETGASEDAARLLWVLEADVCGHAYGVVHRGRDAIVVGAQAGQPWIARVDEQGTLVWDHQQPRSGAYF